MAVVQSGEAVQPSKAAYWVEKDPFGEVDLKLLVAHPFVHTRPESGSDG